MAATYLYQHANTKLVLGCALGLNAVSLGLFTATSDFYLLLLCRFGTGFFQVF